MSKPHTPNHTQPECPHRRTFLKTCALLGGTAAAISTVGSWMDQEASATSIPGEGAYTLLRPEHQIRSVCQQCNTQCGTTVKFKDGRVAKIDGNPYNPWNLCPQIAYNTPITEAASIDAPLCPKGFAGIQTLYDPYRIVKVLKRAGKRGENKWISIPFEQAIQEIIAGGDLFGEGHVEGISELAALRDPKIHKMLAEDAKKVADKKMSLEEFQSKYAEYLKYLIDPNHPDLGPKNNQICYYWGRQKGGRGELIKRFFADGLGTINTHGHTTVCQGSLYFTCKAMSDQFVEGKFTDGSKFYWQADTGNAEFILFVGASPYEANYGPPMRAGKVTQSIVDGGRKIAVVDPRCSKTAGRAWKWIPIVPEAIGALGQAMIRWIIEQERYDARYLANANKAAAKAANEPTWTQACWLVVINDDGTPGRFLRGSDLGHPKETRPSKKHPEQTWEFDAFVTLRGNTPQFFDPNSESEAVTGELFVDTELGGTHVKSVLQIYKETAFSRSLGEWAQVCGIPEAEIVELAQEFTSYGKRAVADIHRGASQHTIGFYNVLTWMTVNVLIGNHDWAGGLTKATTYNATGDKEGMPFPVTKSPNKISPWGISIIRHGVPYDKTTLFEGYPAKRVWYPFASDIYQEVIPSAGDMYPYQIKCLFLYMGTPVYALPGGHKLVEILKNPKKIPLFIASDITVGETSMYADYIFPDLTYLERWEFAGSHPSMSCKVAPIRQPAAAPMTETVTAYGEKMPICLESTLLALAEALNLPNFGPNAWGEGTSFTRMEDLYLRMVANIAFGEKADGSDKVPPASPEEERIFLQARAHLPETIFHPERWKAIVGPELWPHVVTVLNRGGRFQEYAKAYNGNQLANKYGKMVGIYMENLARTKNSMTGKPYVPHAHWTPNPIDCMGNRIEDEKNGFSFTLITYKTITQTKSRTIVDYWLDAVLPEGFLEMAAEDAARMGLRTGDRVAIISPTNPDGMWDLGHGQTKPIHGKVKVIQGLRPGVVAFPLGFGHWANGAGDMVIDGVSIPGDPRRARGFHANAAMRLDPVLENTGLVDTVGGSAVFYQSRVKIVKLA